MLKVFFKYVSTLFKPVWLRRWRIWSRRMGQICYLRDKTFCARPSLSDISFSTQYLITFDLRFTSSFTNSWIVNNILDSSKNILYSIANFWKISLLQVSTYLLAIIVQRYNIVFCFLATVYERVCDPAYRPNEHFRGFIRITRLQNSRVVYETCYQLPRYDLFLS